MVGMGIYRCKTACVSESRYSDAFRERGSSPLISPVFLATLGVLALDPILIVSQSCAIEAIWYYREGLVTEGHSELVFMKAMLSQAGSDVCARLRMTL